MWKMAAYAHSFANLDALKQMGFKYVSLHPMLFNSPQSKPFEMGGIPSEETVGRVKDALDRTGLEPVDLQTFGAWGLVGCSGIIGQTPASPSDPAYERMRESGVQIFVKLVEICKALGCDQITGELGGSPIYHLDHEAAWTKSVQQLRPVLRKENVKLSCLPHPGDFLEESNPVVDMIRRAKCKEVGYLYCIPHTFVLAGRYDADVQAMIEYAEDMLLGVQLADSLKPIQTWLYQHREINKVHSHLLPGKGMVDIKAALTTLKKIDYDGPLILIPYRYGMYPMNFLDLISESKSIVEKLAQDI